MELTLVVIVIAALCVVLAFLLGFMVSRGEESVAEHAAYLKGVRDERKRAEREKEKL